MAGRVVVAVTCTVVAALGGLLAVTQSHWGAAAVAALAAVAAVGVEIWTALRSKPEARVRVARTGDAYSGQGGFANTGMNGPRAGLRGTFEIEQTGRAEASGSGTSNTGINLI